LKAVILAAGEGQRMRPLTANRPKVMLPVACKPILEHLLLEIKASGISEFIFVVGYGDKQLRSHFGTGEKWGVQIEYSDQRKQLGTADAIRMVEDMVDGNFLAMNGDHIVNRADIKKLIKSKTDTMGVIEVQNAEGLGILELADGKVVGVYEKVKNPPTMMANPGLYFFTPAVFDAIAKTEKSPRGEYEITDSLKILMKSKPGLRYLEISTWVDLSYPWDLLRANEAMMPACKGENLGEIEPGVTLKGEVAIGKGTVVKSGSYIEGPVIIGEDCRIGPNCFIRACTTIGNDCHIGAGVEVKNSIIMDHTAVPHLNYVGDSVIGEKCNFGAGTKIANLRLDKRNIWINGIDTGRRKLGAIIGDNVQTGINTSINVGTFIGNDSFIGPGAVVTGVVAPNSKIF
jgi:UDP-N-acetylglucosamine diphosphorylase/glucosamine-1-phosphate N-acetyltransferase